MVMLVTFALLAGMASPLSTQATADDSAAHARAAQAAEQRNDFPDAVSEYRILGSRFPHNAEVLSNLGVALYFNHQWPQAIDVFRKAVALNPALLAPHLFSGLAWFRLSNPDAAVPELEKAVHIHSSDPLATTWLGYAYSAQARYRPAVAEFEAAARLDPNNADVWYALGQTWLAIGKEATRHLLETAPDGARVWQMAGEQCQLRGEDPQALHDFEQAYTRRPSDRTLRKLIVSLGATPPPVTTRVTAQNTASEDALYRDAHEAEQQSRAAFAKVEQLAPDSYRAHEVLADSLVARKQDLQAIEEYRTVLKLNPTLPDIHEAIGEALVRSGRLPEALKEFQEELRVQPESAAAHMNAGRVLLMQGHDDAAAEMLAAALREDRPPAEASVLMAKVELRHHDDRAAIAHLTRYLAEVKTDSTAWYLLFTACREAGDQQQMRSAMDMYRKTSRDTQERNAARRELEPPEDAMRVPDELSPRPPAAIHE
ncbi:MAG TPA: tetratricopeptide repeat protein [Acidobacteriaceae bacterium]|jgi:Tfp pilus assembly protein PilF|nr:tetratricopeptide repeat protein [Acidobacteriaceae bacterium]